MRFRSPGFIESACISHAVLGVYKGRKCQIDSGGLCDALNKALWWVTIMLLVTYALTDQNNESQLLMGPKYAIKKDGCY